MAKYTYLPRMEEYLHTRNWLCQSGWFSENGFTLALFSTIGSFKLLTELCTTQIQMAQVHKYSIKRYTEKIHKILRKTTVLDSLFTPNSLENTCAEFSF